MTQLTTLSRDVSPPPTRRRKDGTDATKHVKSQEPTLAAIEAGEAQVRDHLSYFLKRLATVVRAGIDSPRLQLRDFRELYQRNSHSHGRHFVIHQHDHPISGVHYDLRLQFSASSTISFAIPYGMPGNPNSLRPNRMAIETRVHNLWNNLIESASYTTGSLLIWDTGEYEILPRNSKTQKVTDDEESDCDGLEKTSKQSQSELLAAAFKSRHIRLRLHGSRLPHNYTVALRLPTRNDRAAQPNKPSRKRRRQTPSAKQHSHAPSDSESELSKEANPPAVEEKEANDAALASEGEMDAEIRINNAYPGAFNSIGSIHQRYWFLTLDRPNSGFVKARGGSDAGRWTGKWDTFFVRGREHERSLITGRLAEDIMADDGIQEFVGRKMWRPITE